MCEQSRIYSLTPHFHSGDESLCTFTAYYEVLAKNVSRSGKLTELKVSLRVNNGRTRSIIGTFVFDEFYYGIVPPAELLDAGTNIMIIGSFHRTFVTENIEHGYIDEIFTGRAFRSFIVSVPPEHIPITRVQVAGMVQRVNNKDRMMELHIVPKICYELEELTTRFHEANSSDSVLVVVCRYPGVEYITANTPDYVMVQPGDCASVYGYLQNVVQEVSGRIKHIVVTTTLVVTAQVSIPAGFEVVMEVQ